MTALLSLLAAFVGYSIHATAQAGQKIGLAIAVRHRVRGLTVWTLATLSMPLSVFLVLFAVSIGNASLVGAMSGSGLISLAIFSHLQMHERISKRELLGVFIITAAATLIGCFNVKTTPTEPALTSLYIYLPVVCGLYLLLWFLFRHRDRIVGVVIAGLSGALGGFVPLFQKMSTSPRGLSKALLHFHFRAETFA